VTPIGQMRIKMSTPSFYQGEYWNHRVQMGLFSRIRLSVPSVSAQNPADLPGGVVGHGYSDRVPTLPPRRLSRQRIPTSMWLRCQYQARIRWPKNLPP